MRVCACRGERHAQLTRYVTHEPRVRAAQGDGGKGRSVTGIASRNDSTQRILIWHKGACLYDQRERPWPVSLG